MSDKLEQMFLDFVTVYLHDREMSGVGNGYVEHEIERLINEAEANSTDLLHSAEYD